MFGSSSPEVPYTTFRDNLVPYGINSLGEWCNKCGTTTARGCDVIDALNDTMNDFASPASTTGRQHVSPVVSGVIGAVVGIVAAMVFMFVGGALFKKKSRPGVGASQYRARSAETESVSRPLGSVCVADGIECRLMRWTIRMARQSMRRSRCSLGGPSNVHVVYSSWTL